ncbi:50S ribosomal protein L9 [Candidatus Anaplasma sp. TIGMIC]|uniref:50S ribosomal protein L9 n=1 Tax=Candidatus Anaplasma sp. TIGMIC TaxID=3020713 RepID=UPI00232C5744|nr:50S ribosomal protein L9 [Candidatus Anaplasma sp. TIGMIC]MDB1135136.1 50S ribosomal protein L9 [Candidatus Anaplasma sp. TIGMIC]
MLSVILKSSIRGLGKAGEVAQVKPGYARYLLSDGKAVRATKRNMELLSEKLAAMESESRQKLEEAEGVARALEAECLIMVRQASDDGRLFGSVTVRDVAKLLNGIGYSVQPKEVFFGEVIKRVGEYDINVELHADLVSVVKLHVVKNEADAEVVKLNIARDRKSKVDAAAKAEEQPAVTDEDSGIGAVDSGADSEEESAS